MMRYTIDEYSQKFKMSKEMIHSKLKSKTLDYVVENNKVFIIVQEQEISSHTSSSKQSSVTPKPKPTVATILGLYQKENTQLKEKIVQLENKIDRLINDKEQMLRAERDKIEKLYTTKDEQLKNILELINTKLMIENRSNTIHEVEPLQNKEEEHAKKESELIELRDYLKSLDLKSYQRKTIKKRFLNVYDSDVRIIQQNGKLYLDLSRYDYSDLLAF